MVAERDQSAVAIDAAFEKMKTGRPVEIVLYVVLSAPQQLHGLADLLRDPGGLDHIVAAQAPPEAAPDARHMDEDFACRHAEGRCHNPGTAFGVLGRCP
jgi:hypothetical protein